MADRLEDAFRALREERDGSSPKAEQTLDRVLSSARTRTRRRSRAWKLVLPIAAVLVASSAWAGATGRLSSMWSAITDAPPEESAPGAPARGAATSLPAPTSDPAIVAAEVAPSAVASPPPSVAVVAPAPTADAAVPRPAVTATASAPVAIAPAVTASAPEPVSSQGSLAADKADFEAAYRVHASGAAAEAVAAWDGYLTKHPGGRFGPEARYARAVALVRSGNASAARQALRPFADAAPGSYRRDDALRLLETLGD